MDSSTGSTPDPTLETGSYTETRNDTWDTYLREHERCLNRCPGDVAVFRVGRCFAHAGIVSRADPLRIIHAFVNTGRVLEDIIPANAELASRPKKFASFWG